MNKPRVPYDNPRRLYDWLQTQTEPATVPQIAAALGVAYDVARELLRRNRSQFVQRTSRGHYALIPGAGHPVENRGRPVNPGPTFSAPRIPAPAIALEAVLGFGIDCVVFNHRNGRLIDNFSREDIVPQVHSYVPAAERALSVGTAEESEAA